uniref:RRM domain-containing protein n=1 Tax=Phytophthora ramorum TaxID=164328 RepID=H3HCZ6_PHYRM
MVVNAPADERFCLRIRNLPAVLSTEAITSLISHYGSTRVRVLQRRNAASSGKEPGAAPSKQLQKAVAIFATREAQQNARRRLHSLVLAGQHLQVEVVGDEAATASTETRPQPVQTGDELPLKGQPPLPKGLPPPLPPTPTPMQNLLYAPAPLAPHLGLHYAPSPLLEYKYPKATEGINRGPETKKSAALNVAFQLGTDTGNTPRSRRLTRPGVISENEVKRQRLAQG